LSVCFLAEGKGKLRELRPHGMSNDWERLIELFEAAVARAPAERSSFVREACGDDSDLRRQVEAMLAEGRLPG
jgi:hypothetical protein